MKTKLGVANVRPTLWACAAIGALVAAGPAAGATVQCESVVGNLVANCGFENRDSRTFAPTDWSTGGANGHASVLAGYAHTGTRYLQIEFSAPGTSFVSQLVGGAGTYNVSFWLDLFDPGASTNPPTDLSVTFGDQSLSVSLSENNTQDQNYRFFEFTNVTTATPAELKIQISGIASPVQYPVLHIDDVVVTTVSVASAVPEPSSLALGLGGLAGLALWRRRQRRGHAAA